MRCLNAGSSAHSLFRRVARSWIGDSRARWKSVSSFMIQLRIQVNHSIPEAQTVTKKHHPTNPFFQKMSGKTTFQVASGPCSRGPGPGTLKNDDYLLRTWLCSQARTYAQ